ncbi:hypothetical protein [Hymenobacter jeollabukensis]|uniref:Uncharacterized protein n=1 Tax=Hymenobacter jeollabukensis TaxID=2025313 RepID=A0A5R8WKG2_9BACT|nr:hypothetical protein [Hymenobacter jeollabukensis]TLM88991.1 hypothetical protein FDY95_22685 [Hymenobacter jeollabukensis]
MGILLSTQAQNKRLNYAISLDTAQEKRLPYDLPFTVRIPYDKEDPIKSVYYIKVSRRGDFIPDKTTSYPKNAAILNALSLVSLQEENGKQSLLVDLPPLKPDKRYILLTSTEKNKKIASLRYVTNYCVDPTAYIRDEEYSLRPYYYYTDVVRDRNKFVAKGLVIKRDLNALNANCDICNKLNELEQVKNVKVGGRITPYTGPFLNTNLPYYNSPGCDSCYKANAKELAFALAAMNTIETWREDILTGKYRLDTVKLYKTYIKTDLVVSNSPAQRVEYLQSTLSVLVKLKQSLLLLNSLYSSASFSPEYLNNIVTLNSYIDKCSTNLAIIQSDIDAVNKQQNIVNSCLESINLPVGLQFNTIRSGTSSYRFYTRNAEFIKPDFGVIYYGSPLTRKADFSGAAPFVGFHVNFRATNSNVPFWSNPKLLQFPTLQFGVPIFAQSLSQDESRKHLVADKFSLFTGLGLNLAHTVRLHYGAVWFQSLTSIRGAERNYRVASIQYVGFSIDIRLRKLFPGLTDSIFGVKDVPSY